MGGIGVTWLSWDGERCLRAGEGKEVSQILEFTFVVEKRVLSKVEMERREQ